MESNTKNTLESLHNLATTSLDNTGDKYCYGNNIKVMPLSFYDKNSWGQNTILPQPVYANEDHINIKAPEHYDELFKQ